MSAVRTGSSSLLLLPALPREFSLRFRFCLASLHLAFHIRLPSAWRTTGVRSHVCPIFPCVATNIDTAPARWSRHIAGICSDIATRCAGDNLSRCRQRPFLLIGRVHLRSFRRVIAKASTEILRQVPQLYHSTARPLTPDHIGTIRHTHNLSVGNNVSGGSRNCNRFRP